MALLGSVIPGVARRYTGRWFYVFGGTPMPPTILEGDCSSFVSMILGYNLRLALPGGKWGDPGFPPNEHGPDVADYIAWRGAVDVTSPDPGDLVCYGPNEHIGFAVDSENFISALNPDLGVRVEPILGGASGPVYYRRVTGVEGVGLPGPVGQLGSQVLQGTGTGPVVAVLVAFATAAGMFGLAVLVAAVGIPLIVRKVMS